MADNLCESADDVKYKNDVNKKTNKKKKQNKKQNKKKKQTNKQTNLYHVFMQESQNV